MGVNEPADMNDLSDLEKKHLPVIEAPEKATVGENFELLIEFGRQPCRRRPIRGTTRNRRASGL